MGELEEPLGFLVGDWFWGMGREEEGFEVGEASSCGNRDDSAVVKSGGKVGEEKVEGCAYRR